MNNPKPEQLTAETARQIAAALDQGADAQIAAVGKLEAEAPIRAARSFQAVRNAHALMTAYFEYVDVLLAGGDGQEIVSRSSAHIATLGEYSPDLLDVAVALATHVAQGLGHLSAAFIADPEMDPGCTDPAHPFAAFVQDAVATLVPMAAWVIRNVVGIDTPDLAAVSRDFAASEGMADLLGKVKEREGGRNGGRTEEEGASGVADH